MIAFFVDFIYFSFFEDYSSGRIKKESIFFIGIDSVHSCLAKMLVKSNSFLILLKLGRAKVDKITIRFYGDIFHPLYLSNYEELRPNILLK